MAVISQKEAAKRFAKKWEGQGREKQDDSKFWLELLSFVFRIEDPFKLIEFQKPVKMESSTRFIDAFMPETRVLIEQKGVDIDLSKKYQQSGGDMLTPYEQARRYDQWMLPDEHPLWIVVCNFRSFEIHDMRHPFDAPEVVLLENLANEYTRLSFITDADRLHIQREQRVSMDAGKIVGNIYDALQKQYVHPDDEAAKHSLNVLCVRLVFCLYAEDAGIFGKDQFHDYLKDVPAEDMREAVLKLFEVLDTPEGERSPYLKEKLKSITAMALPKGITAIRNAVFDTDPNMLRVTLFTSGAVLDDYDLANCPERIRRSFVEFRGVRSGAKTVFEFDGAVGYYWLRVEKNLV